jgi:16S rRNA (guanine527-N7)-methyltransferase
VDLVRIAELLRPFLGEDRLSDFQLGQIATYIDLLLRWNARMNLTSVRDPEEIVARHFGESFFLARHVLDCGHGQDLHCIDIGSGAGFPGLPIKIYSPQAHLTLIESQHRKAIFLREVIRALSLTDAEVFAGRAEDLAPETAHTGDLVTMRAVERFEEVLPAAGRLVRGGNYSGTLALLIGASAVNRTTHVLPEFQWRAPLLIPQSTSRVLLLGSPKP